MRKGFTLAEILITLSIIGIVAAITMPSIIANIQEKVLLTQLQQAYSIISQATEQMLKDNETDFNGLGSTADERIAEYKKLLPKYLQITQTCKLGKAAGYCTAKVYKWLLPDGTMNIDRYNVINNKDSFLLANGMSITAISPGFENCYLYKNFTYSTAPVGGGGTYGYSCGNFFIDINGKKGPNEINKDIFKFFIVRDGIIPAGMPQETTWCQTFTNACGRNAADNYALHMCTAWALQNKNMDYLKCKGLDWNGKTRCK